MTDTPNPLDDLVRSRQVHRAMRDPEYLRGQLEVLRAAQREAQTATVQ
jgi:hypothetical protein